MKPIITLFIIGFALTSLTGQNNVKIIEEEDVIKGIGILCSASDSYESISSNFGVRLKGAEQLIIGTYKVQDTLVLFTPQWPLERSQTYEVIYFNQVLKTLYAEESDNEPIASVQNIYPSSDSIPENLLKFYIQFTHPMSEGQSSKYLTLLENGQDTVYRAFLDLNPELWDTERKRLTIWIEPGRVKRDLGPNKMLGGAFKEGKFYKLLISNNWRDINGIPMKNDYEKKYHISVSDRERPDPKKWLVKTPKANSFETIKLEFFEQLDYVLVSEFIEVFFDQEKLLGLAVTAKDGGSYEFKPSTKWQVGDYSIRIDKRLEDLAGNNLRRLFDVDLSTENKNDKIMDEAYHYIPFKVQSN